MVRGMQWTCACRLKSVSLSIVSTIDILEVAVIVVAVVDCETILFTERENISICNELPVAIALAFCSLTIYFIATTFFLIAYC